MKNVLDKSCRENQHTYFIFNNFFKKKKTTIYEMSKNVVGPDRP
jgi:hypothetical protein